MSFHTTADSPALSARGGALFAVTPLAVSTVAQGVRSGLRVRARPARTDHNWDTRPGIDNGGTSTFTVTASYVVAPDATSGELTISVATVPVATAVPGATARTPPPAATRAVPVSSTASFTG